MVEELVFENERGDTLTFSPASVYHVNMKDVAGLSDIRNYIFSVNSMWQHGDTYLGSRIEAREIEITGRLAIKDKEEAREARRRLTRTLSPEFNARLQYRLGSFQRVIGCKIAHAPVFVKAPVFDTFVINLTCPSPFWRESTHSRHDVAMWTGGLEFLLPNGLELINCLPWEIGTRNPYLLVNVFNAGDVSTGISIEFRALGSVVNPLLMNIYTGEFVKMNFTMLAGDNIHIKTGFGEKNAFLTRHGETTNIFRHISHDSTFLQLSTGDNVFKFDAEQNVDSLEVTVRHTNLFLGV